MYLYPTKALAQDQARSLSALSPPNLRLAIYDGDTPQAERRQVRGWANLLLTNPDMLHTGILPAHGIWAESLHRLRYVVVDEAHVYRGVFGSHVANVLARLRRICEHYGSQPAFILASATIANPGAGRLDAGRAPGRGDRGRRGAGRGARGRRLEPAPARPRVRHPGEHAGRGGDAARRAGRPRPADDRVRPLAQGLRAGLPVRPRGTDPERARPPRPHRPLPRRLHARAASHDRTRAGGRHPARRGRHQRARARHRHRHARLLDLRRLPGRHVVAAPAVGPRRAAGARGWGCWSPARISSTSTWRAIRRSCSTGRPKPRSRIRRTRRCSPATCGAPPRRCR